MASGSVGVARPDSCLGMAIRRRLRAGKAGLELTGRPAIRRPAPRQAVRKRRPSPNLLRHGVTRLSRIPRRPPRRTGLRRTALRRTALAHPLLRPTTSHLTKPPNRRARLPAACRAGPPGSLAGDRAHRPAALPPGPVRHRHQPPRPPGSKPSPSPNESRSRRTRRSRPVRRSRQLERPPVSSLRRSPPVKRQGQGPQTRRRSPSLPARLPSHSQPLGRPDRTGRLVLVRRTRSRQGAGPSQSGAKWYPRS